MESMRNQRSIQMLLTAEQEAQNIVSAARNLKLSRLKQAKEEAEKEAAVYRSRLETEFKNKITQSSGDSGSTVKMLDEQTEAKIKSLKESASKVEPDIVNMLINYVSAIKY